MKSAKIKPEINHPSGAMDKISGANIRCTTWDFQNVNKLQVDLIHGRIARCLHKLKLGYPSSNSNPNSQWIKRLGDFIYCHASLRVSDVEFCTLNCTAA